MVASWPTLAVALRTSIAGMVSDRLMSSSMSDEQETDALALSAALVTTTELLNVEMPPPLESDLVSTEHLVSGAAKVTLQPVSRFCVAPAKVMPVNSQLARLPTRKELG